MELKEYVVMLLKNYGRMVREVASLRFELKNFVRVEDEEIIEGMVLSSKKGDGIHALRYTFATRLMEQNVPIRITQNLMGHASIVTTEQYSHVLDDEKRKAIDRMSDFLPGVEEQSQDILW